MLAQGINRSTRLETTNKQAKLDNPLCSQESETSNSQSETESCSSDESFFIEIEKKSKPLNGSVKEAQKPAKSSLRQICVEPDSLPGDYYKFAYPIWLREMEAGYVPLLHGYGSKSCVLRDFGAYLEQRSRDLGIPVCVVLVRAYHALSGARAIARLCNDLKDNIKLQKTGCSSYYILIQSIDAPPFRCVWDHANPGLSELASIPGVRILATSDGQLIGGLTWNHALFGVSSKPGLRFVMHNVHTFQGYTKESNACGSIRDALNDAAGGTLSAHGMATAETGIRVLRVLPQKTRKVFQRLAKWSVSSSNKDEDQVESTEYHSFCRGCRQAFLVHDDSELRGMLGELEDHGLVRVEWTDGVESIGIPLCKDSIENILSCSGLFED